MAIAFVNTANGVGGMYHYPGMALLKGNETRVEQTLLRMVNGIGAHTITLTPGKQTGWGTGSDEEDIASVLTHLKKWFPSTRIEQAGACVMGCLYWEDASLLYNPSLGDLPLPRDQRVADYFETGSHKNGFSFYSGNGNNAGVLDQQPHSATDPANGGRGCRMM